MRFVDARRLTGANRFSQRPLVLAEFSGVASGAELARQFSAALGALLGPLEIAPDEHPGEVRVALGKRGDAELYFSAPVDLQLAYAELAEVVGRSICPASDPVAGECIEALRQQFFSERSLALRALEGAAAAARVPLLIDDEEVSLGAGPACVRFARNSVPESVDLFTEHFPSIPTVLITGTNGKTTTARLLAAIASETGYCVGATSTDGVVIDGVVREEGDWTGPAAARRVLRDREVTFAVLETARGGILRRGLAVSECDVAVLTNVSADHLGDYGIDTVEQMLAVKAVILQGARQCVLPARIYAASPAGVLRAAFASAQDQLPSGEALHNACILFGLDTPADVAVLEAHTKASGRAVFSRGGVLWAAAGAHESPVIHLADVPITFGGLAIYNVENVAAAVAAAVALNLPLPEIAEALRSFGASKNPGRGELVDRNGVRVFADFAHNAAGVLALKPLMDGLKSASKLFVIAGAAGDRRDDELVELADAVASLAPEWVFVRDLKGYERGRAPGEVPALLLRELAQHGVRGEEATGEVVALKAALQRAVPGDVIALLAHIERDEVAVFLATKEP